MNNVPPQVTLAELSRWLRVEPGEQRDRLELASAWQLIPHDSPSRTIARLGVGLLVAILALLVFQAAAVGSSLLLAVAGLAMLAAAAGAWHLRTWFWRTVLDVDSEQISLTRKGWGVPGVVALPLDQVQTLTYRMQQGQLVSLDLEYEQGRLALPYSGQRELDKLYCNILLHLLQKRRPAIHFSSPDEHA